MSVYLYIIEQYRTNLYFVVNLAEEEIKFVIFATSNINDNVMRRNSTLISEPNVNTWIRSCIRLTGRSQLITVELCLVLVTTNSR